MRSCKICFEDIVYEGCDKLVNQRKEFSVNLNELKRQAPNEFGDMLPS